MELEKKAKSNKKWAYIIGIGLALFPIHNVWLTEVTSINSMVTLFLPAIGAIIWVLGVLLFIRDNWRDLKLGDKKIFIPLIIIVLSMGLSGFIYGDGITGRFAPLFIGVAFFFAYIVSRSLGKDIFRMLIPFVILGAIISIILGIVNPGVDNGGLITNYCSSAGFLIFGAVVNQGKWQWALILVALIGVFFIGALEAVFIIGVIGITVLARRDWNKYLLIVMGVFLAFVALLLFDGNLIPLYTGNHNLEALSDIITGKVLLDANALNALTSQRWEVYVEAIKNFNFIGYGYSGMDLMAGRNIHNVPLNIMNGVGVLAAISWLGLSLYCAIKTKWHYAWVAVLAMSVWDHYLWTQFGAMWWVLIGVSATSTIKSDLIFRRVYE